MTKVFDTPGKYHWFLGKDDANAVWSLWRTDGTVAGTRKLREGIMPPTTWRYHEGRGVLFFTTGESAGGASADYEPWVSDGTPAGTRLVKDLRTDTSSGADSYKELGSHMLFLARGVRTPGNALWRSDGTAGGTQIVLEPEIDWLKQLQTAGNRAFLLSFAPSNEAEFSWWSTDGSTGGAVELARFEGVYDLRLSKDLGNGRSLWTLLDENDPASLWVTDGTPGGTAQLMSLALPNPYVHLNHFVRYRGVWYFTADDGTTGLELWRTDGTPEGTEVAFETCPGLCTDSPAPAFLEAGELLEIWLTDAEHGRELWATDGTLEGTRPLVDLCPGTCSPATLRWHGLGGLHLFFMAEMPSTGKYQLWATDLTPEGTRQLTELELGAGNPSPFGTALLDGQYLFLGGNDGGDLGVWALPIGSFDPPAPLGDWLASPEAPGFAFKARISTPSGSILGTKEPACIPETVCVSGAVPGRSEVFLRVVGPKPNGFLWPTLVKFSTSTVEVWARQEATGGVRYYKLEGARPGFDELPGLFDRQGFEPVAQGTAASQEPLPAGLVAAEPTVLAAGNTPAPPAGAVFTSPHFPDFRFRARISAGDQAQEVRQEAACIEETLCLSAALPGRSEVFLRIVGPKPNGRLWPTIVKFTTSTLEVWIEQVSTGETGYYRIEGAAPGKDDLTGLFDRVGFAP
ncbi:MAG TPA: hypothetical protein VLF66_00735 [Thermoanaerobaculia bacterium]|nr:hypothetical protein [Thermoanaerobaculia bacterium]